MSFLEAALKLASQGFYVFPLLPDGKTPAFEGWQNQATRDPEKIRQLWTDFTGRECDYNIGIFTSRFGDGEALIAVDVDNKKGKNGAEQLLKLELEGKTLPPTWEQITPTGGRHLVYRVKEPVGNGVNSLAPGIDTRSKGGYVVGAGSRIGGKEYIPIPRAIGNPPEWVISACGRRVREKPNVLHMEMFDAGRANNRATHYLQNEAPIAVEGNGGDHTTFSVAAKLKDFGVSQADALDLMLRHWNDRCQPPWHPHELERKVDNAYRYGLLPQGAIAPEAQFSPIKEDEPRPTARILPFRHYSEIKPNLARRALVQKLLNPGDVSLVFAEANNGKSWFSIDLAHSIATGQEFLGRKVQQHPVVYIVAEGAEGFKKRVAAYQKQKGLNPQAVPFYMIDEHINLLNEQAEDLKALVATLRHIEEKAGPVGLLIIDTMARVMGAADENSSEDMNLFNARVTRIAKETGTHVMVIHHAGKDSSKGARGHSSLRAAVDTEIRVEKKSDDTFVATVTKQRDQEFGEPLAFRLEKVVLGKDLDGEIVDSCVVVKATPPRKAQHLSPVAAEALQVLERLSEKDGIFDLKAVPLVDWRDAFWAEFYPDANRKTKASAWSRAKSELVTKERVSVDSEHATLIGDKS